MPDDRSALSVTTSVTISLIKNPADAVWPGMDLQIMQNGICLHRELLVPVVAQAFMVADAQYILSDFDNPLSVVIDFDFGPGNTGSMIVNEICFDDIFLMLDLEKQGKIVDKHDQFVCSGNQVTQDCRFVYEVSLPISATALQRLSYYRPLQ